jgi:hypothetical protein
MHVAWVTAIHIVEEEVICLLIDIITGILIHTRTRYPRARVYVCILIRSISTVYAYVALAS